MGSVIPMTATAVPFYYTFSHTHTHQLVKLSSSHATHFVKAKPLHTIRSRTYTAVTAHHDCTLVKHSGDSQSKSTYHCVRALLCCTLAEHKKVLADGSE